jgi:hypothetical protein
MLESPAEFCIGRDLNSTITQGRVITRLVSMFQSIEELVDENDRRRALEIEGHDEEHSPE